MKPVFLLLLPLLIRADLPVHCLKHQIEGQWKLSVTKPLINGHGPLPCGHHVPDTQHSSYKAGWDDFKESESFTLKLNNDYSVEDGTRRSQGFWTMVYDEGFEIKFKEVSYLAFSRYAPNGRDF